MRVRVRVRVRVCAIHNRTLTTIYFDKKLINVLIWFDFTIDILQQQKVLLLFRGVVCWSFVLREVTRTQSVSRSVSQSVSSLSSLSHTHIFKHTLTKGEQRERAVEWNGVVCKQHVLSTEREQSIILPKPHTQYTTSVLYVFCSLSCCCGMWMLLLLLFLKKDTTRISDLGDWD
jgi:hypothetical protein